MAKKPDDTAPAPATQVIYLGPTMAERKGGQVAFSIARNTIYKNGVPYDVAARQEADADFKKLFVPVEGAARAMADLAKDTPLRAVFSRVQAAYQARMRG